MKLKPGESVKGMVPSFEVTAAEGENLKVSEIKLVPWQEAIRVGPENTPNPNLAVSETEVQTTHDRLYEGLPAPVRRTSKQRYDALVLKLLNYARACVKEYGHTAWPMSLQKILDEKGVKAKATPEQEVYALAEHFIVKAENQQRRKDHRKVVSDWHGHYD